MTCTGTRSPLQHGGTTQTGRALNELTPDYFRIDERELADLVLYGQALSREIRYYSAGNQPDGDWEAFFASDLTAVLAALARLPVDAFRTAARDAEEFLKAEPTRPELQLQAYFNLLFHLPVALFGMAAAAQRRLGRDHPLHRELLGLVESDLVLPFSEMMRYYNGAVGAALPLGDPEPALNPGDFGTGAPADLRPRLSNSVAALVFVSEALADRDIGGPMVTALGAVDWNGFATGIAGVSTPYQQAAGPNLVYEQIYDALTYNLLVAQFEQIYQALERVRRMAQEALAESLSKVDDHTPHYGLYLALLEMLAVARQELNGLTARHLDFYYREVLRLAPRGPVPASAHVLLQLARGEEASLVASGTELRAGKDALGNSVVFETTDDLVANRGQVSGLRAIQVHTAESGGNTYQTVFASPTADSSDGLGADLAEPLLGWRPFGPAPYAEGITQPQAPFGRVGFAVADRRLFLREGVRSILVGFELDDNLAGIVLPAMTARLTTPDGWHTVSAFGIGPFFLPKLMVFAVLLDGDQPPVVPYDPDVHAEENGEGYPEGLPVLELTFAFEGETDNTASAFALLRDARIAQSYLYVSAAGLRNLALQTPDGAADSSKPFTPFGAQPKTNAGFLVGSAEIFAKPINNLRLNVTWDPPYSANDYFLKKGASDYSVQLSYLAKGAWSTAPTPVNLALGSTSPVLYLQDGNLADENSAMVLEEPGFGPTARGGFLRLSLSSDFGHAGYVAELTRATVAMAMENELTENTAYNYLKDPDDKVTVPKSPFAPTVAEITASYDTAYSEPTHFFHVAPFGQRPLASAGETLLPALDYEAALFIGVESFAAPARLSLLLQVANGTGDPLLEVPELDFHYLAGDAWVPFDDQDVDDKTDRLQASAILGLAMPDDADTNHALMPGDLHWVRIAAPGTAPAVNSLLAVRAQAVRAEFADRDNDPQFLKEPLPAETISKPVVSDRAIKGLEQPFASYGGRAREDAETFHQRAAERLRHKDRASTLWDYERLALEAAPELYRVKCLNHTELVRQAGMIVADHELRPGSVVVVTVPWTVGQPHLNPLRPYTDTATRKKVRDVLQSRLSPFINLEVENPRFEEVQASFKVAFLPGIADTAFYLDELQEALVGYLAPWSVEAGADIIFGGTLRKSAVIDFVEELPYVDYLEDVELYHIPDPDGLPGALADKEVIEATTARSILVSAARHSVEELA